MIPHLISFFSVFSYHSSGPPTAYLGPWTWSLICGWCWLVLRSLPRYFSGFLDLRPRDASSSFKIIGKQSAIAATNIFFVGELRREIVQVFFLELERCVCVWFVCVCRQAVQLASVESDE